MPIFEWRWADRSARSQAKSIGVTGNPSRRRTQDPDRMPAGQVASSAAAGQDHHNAGLIAVAAAEETAGIAENLRADEGIGIGAHLDRALLATTVPVDRITSLRPRLRASRLSPLPIAPALLLASRLGQGRPGGHPQHRYGKNDANGNPCHFGLRHGRVSLMNFD